VEEGEAAVAEAGEEAVWPNLDLISNQRAAR